MWIHDLESGEFREFLDRNPPVGWLTDSKIAIWLPGEGLVSVDLESDERTPLYGEAPPRWATISKDLSWVYTTRTDVEGDIWMLDP